MSPSLSALPLAAPMSRAEPQALDVIFIEGLVGQTVIGIHHSELHDPQPLVIDLQAGVPRARACDTDDIGDTIDYSVVRGRMHRLLAEHRVQLLEALAEQMADILLQEFRAHWVRVRLAKPRKFDDLQSVGVMIERRRSQPLEPVGGGGHAAVLRLIGTGMVPGGR